MLLDLDNEKWSFLNEEFLTFSVRGALERAGIYLHETAEKRHQELGEKLRGLLKNYAGEYMKSDKMVPEENSQ